MRALALMFQILWAGSGPSERHQGFLDFSISRFLDFSISHKCASGCGLAYPHVFGRVSALLENPYQKALRGRGGATG
jgi:hypothetical protein